MYFYVYGPSHLRYSDILSQRWLGFLAPLAIYTTKHASKRHRYLPSWSIGPLSSSMPIFESQLFNYLRNSPRFASSRYLYVLERYWSPLPPSDVSCRGASNRSCHNYSEIEFSTVNDTVSNEFVCENSRRNHIVYFYKKHISKMKNKLLKFSTEKKLNIFNRKEIIDKKINREKLKI